jgi:hypothetical protein
MGHIAKVYRIFRWASLAGLVLSIFLLLKTPDPVAQALDPSLTRQNAASFQQKLAELANAQSLGEAGTEVSFTAPEVNAALAQATLPQPASLHPSGTALPSPQASTAQVPITSAQVSFVDDVVKGQFLSQVYGKDVYITVAGHLGSRDGYVIFDPTEFKVGDLSVPVSLVNPALQRKLADPDNREKLKLPAFVKEVRVENGELLISQ